MGDIIFQPQGAGTTRKEGTIVVGSPLAAYTGAPGPNYRIDDYVSNLPTTGSVNVEYSGKFDDPRYYEGDTSA